MAAFSTLALIGGSVLGTAATVYSVKQQKDAAKEQKAQMEAQETAARETASLDAAAEDTGADIKLGRDDTTASTTSAAGGGGATSRNGSVASRVGGLGALGTKRRIAGL